MDPADFYLANASMLATFEPIAGAALAINLAYLNLERFRYKRRMRRRAHQALEEVFGKSAKVPEECKGTVSYKRLERLLDIKDHDGPDDPSAKKKKKNGASLQSELGDMIFMYLFEWNFDFILSFIFAFAAAFVLIAGVAHGALYWEWSYGLATGWQASVVFYFLIFAMFFPVGFVGCGRLVVRWAEDLVTNCSAELAKTKQLLAQSARLKEDPTSKAPGGVWVPLRVRTRPPSPPDQ